MKNPFQLHAGHGLAASRFLPHVSAPDTRPRVVIAAVGKRLERELAAHFAKRGWRVKHAVDAVQARRLAQCGRAEAVVLPADSPGESGFLACAKLARSADETDIRVVLVGEPGEENERYAEFAGAVGYVTKDAPTAEVVEMLAGEFAPLAN